MFVDSIGYTTTSDDSVLYSIWCEDPVFRLYKRLSHVCLHIVLVHYYTLFLIIKFYGNSQKLYLKHCFHVHLQLVRFKGNSVYSLQNTFKLKAILVYQNQFNSYLCCSYYNEVSCLFLFNIAYNFDLLEIHFPLRLANA